LFNTIHPVLYRFALARLDGDTDAAGDIAQAAICKVIAKLHTYRGEAALLTWACVFCRHELYAYEKRHAERPHVELTEDEPEVRAALESLRVRTTADPDALLDRAKVAAFVQRVLDHLPSNYAEALEWKYIDDLSVQEIANQLGIGLKAAESLLTRSRAAFRDAFRTLAGGSYPPFPDPAARGDK
jgi:RNA polymerase sigma-70 factor, ECF subfamily